MNGICEICEETTGEKVVRFSEGTSNWLICSGCFDERPEDVELDEVLLLEPGPRHGEERNRRLESEVEENDFVDMTTGEEIKVRYVSRQETRSEFFCIVCDEWKDVGFLGRLLGCPDCHADWRES